MTWLPVIWTALALCGVGVAIYGLFDIRADGIAMAGRNGVFKQMRRVRYRREFIRLGSLSALALCGILVSLTGTSDVERIVVYLCLYLGTSGLILNSLLEKVDRILLRRML